MGEIASQITSFMIVYSTVYAGANQRKHQSPAPLAFVWGTHRGLVISPYKWPVTVKMFQYDDVITCSALVITALYTLSYYIGPCYSGTPLYVSTYVMWTSFTRLGIFNLMNDHHKMKYYVHVCRLYQDWLNLARTPWDNPRMDNSVVIMDISNHQPHDCLLNSLFRRKSKETPKLHVTGLCEGNSLVTGEFPAQRASNAENVSFDDIIMDWNTLLTLMHWIGQQFNHIIL